MELILWRHAEAEDANAQGDFARALTKRGRKQAERIAGWLRPRLEGDWKVLAPESEPCDGGQRPPRTAQTDNAVEAVGPSHPPARVMA